MNLSTHYFCAQAELFASGDATDTVYLPVAKDNMPGDYIPIIYTLSLEIEQSTDTVPYGIEVFTDPNHLTGYSGIPVFSASKTIAAGETDTIFISFPNGLTLRPYQSFIDNYGLSITSNAINTGGGKRQAILPPAFRLVYGVPDCGDYKLTVTYSYLPPASATVGC